MFFFQKTTPISPSRILLFFVIVSSTWLYFWSQYYIGSVTPPKCGIADLAQIWTLPWNQFLHSHARLADMLLSLHSFLGDMTILFLLILSVWQCSVRACLPLLLFLILRQVLQSSTSLPLSSGMIWRDPGFPSLFSIYGINSDLYFSAYVGIGILGALELSRFGKTWLTLFGFAAALFQVFTDLILRSHYTTDIYTSIITAIAVYLLFSRFIPGIDRVLGKWRTILTALILLGIGGFFATQSLIGQKAVPECGIFDALHDFLLPLNHFLRTHDLIGNASLIFMNTVLDALTVFLMAITLWNRDIRPFLCIVLFMILRQSLQILVALPIPPFSIWYYPGFPSLLQTYEIINDLYFSGHTGVSLLAALELARMGKQWLAILGFSLFGIEVIGVLALQMHYTMDVYTAIMTVICITPLAFLWAPPINRFLSFARKKRL